MDDSENAPPGDAWEAEVKAMSQRLARQSRRSGLVGFLGGAAVMGGLVLVGWAAMHTKQQLDTQVNTNKSLSTEVQSKIAQANDAQQQAVTAKRVLSATVENLQAQSATVSASATSALDQAFDANPAAAKLLVRVYIHIHGQDQRRRAIEVARALRSAGYLVPGIDVKAESVRETQVHYYADDTQSVSDANAIAKVVVGTGVPCAVRQVPRAAVDQSKPRAYGLWLAPEIQ
jgi:hypothetical protein